MQQDPLLDAHIRTERYWNVDGLSEIAMGIWVLLFALCHYGISQTASGSLGRVVLVLVFAVGLPAALVLSGPLLVAVRRRFTYRRTGFVAHRQVDRRSWIAGAALAVSLALVLLILMAVDANWVAGLFVLQGLIPGALMIYFGRLVRLLRFQLIGVIYMVFGIGVALAEPGLSQGMTIFWAGIGAVNLLSGGVTFWRYVRLHPHVAEAQ